METKLDIQKLEDWGIFPDSHPLIMSGPCSAESEEQVMETARGLKALGVNVFRAGIWKPRTLPNNFEGVGAPGLAWLKRVKDELGMKICTEVASKEHLYECLKYGIDMIWIGARTTVNPFLVQEIADAIAGADIPVLVKNPVNPDIDLWIGALKRLNQMGIKKLGVIHRGFSSFETIKYRNNPGWELAIELKSRYPKMPFFCDPSHMGGAKEYLHEISQLSLDLGLDGLMIESHCNPCVALSDAKQQLTPEELGKLIDVLKVRNFDSDNPEYKDNIYQLRAKIDVIDENILYTMGARMNVCRQIGEYKKANNITILQTNRWDSILGKVIAKGKDHGLSEKFITDVFSAIHEASIEEQNDIISGKKSS